MVCIVIIMALLWGMAAAVSLCPFRASKLSEND